MVIPGLVIIVDDSSSKTPCRVDASSSDGNRREVDHEHSEPNWQRGQDLHKKHPDAQPMAFRTQFQTL